MTIMATSKALPLVQYLIRLNLTTPIKSDALNVSVLLGADIYQDQLGIIKANYGFDGYMGVPGLNGVDEASRQAAYDYGVSWQSLDPALNAATRAYYSAVGADTFLSVYGVPAVAADTIPVVFSHPVLGTTVTPEAFEIELNTGERVTPLTASLLPNEEYNERQTIVLSGHWGNRLPSDDPNALHPTAVRIVETDVPLTFVTPEGLVSAAGLEKESASPYDEGNGPRLVAANLDVYSDLGEGSPFWILASNANAGSDLYADAAQFRLRLYTSAGFSPDGIASILPTEFSRYFRIEAIDATGAAVWLEETGIDYAIPGYGTVRIEGLADTGPGQATYDDGYVEDHDNQYDVILSGDQAAIERIVRVEMPSSGDYSPVYNPGGPGNDLASNPDVPFTVHSSPHAIEVSNLIGKDPYVSFVEIDGSVYRDPTTGQPVGENLGIAIHDTGTGHIVNQYVDPYGRLFYASFDVNNEFHAPQGQHPILFDAVYYLRQNPDVRDAFQANHDLAWRHYLEFGAREAIEAGDAASRAPTPWFDIAYYLDSNPDVAAASSDAAFAFQHFLEFGMMEWRAPNPLAANDPLTPVALLAYAHANADLMNAYGVDNTTSELSPEQQYDLALHFHRWGYTEGRSSEPTSLVPDVDWQELAPIAEERWSEIGELFAI